MIVQIKARDENGRYQSACAGDFAASAIKHVIDEWGWNFLRLWLGRVCLLMAQGSNENHAGADLWIRRYQAIRGIK